MSAHQSEQIKLDSGCDPVDGCNEMSRTWGRPHVGGDRDGLNVFEVLIPGALGPGQELLDGPVISGAGFGVADWDGKKLKEFFPC